MRKLFVFVVCFLVANLHGLALTAGSNAAYLKGQSESGRTQFICELQDVTAGLIRASWRIDSHTISFGEDDEAHVIYDLANQVFCIVLKDAQGHFVYFWVLPKSIRKISGDWFRGRFEFKAKVYGTDPRPDKGGQSPETILRCTFAYEV